MSKQGLKTGRNGGEELEPQQIKVGWEGAVCMFQAGPAQSSHGPTIIEGKGSLISQEGENRGLANKSKRVLCRTETAAGHSPLRPHKAEEVMFTAAAVAQVSKEFYPSRLTL